MLYTFLSGSGGSLKPYSYVFYNGTVPSSTYTSRANRRSCGSGPYFKGVATPESFTYPNGKSVSKATTYYRINDQWSRECGIYTDWDDGYYFIASPRNKTVQVWRNYSKLVTVNSVTYVDQWTIHRISYDQSNVDLACNAIKGKRVTVGLIYSIFPDLSYDESKPYNRTAVINSQGKVIGGSPIASFEDCNLTFPDNCLAVFSEAAEFGWFRFGYASKFQTAYVNAVSTLSLSEVNTLANIVELMSAVQGFFEFVREPVSVFKNLLKTMRDPRNAWLAYRYSYKTTQADVKEYKATLSRLRALGNMLGKDIHAIGDYSDDYGSYRCEIRLAVTQVFPSDAVERLEAIGLSPSPKNLWDLIPYSFVVDWFLNVGDILDWADKIGNTFDYDPKDVWFTYKRQFGNQFYFFRVPGRKLDVTPYYEESHASGKTIRMRIADSVALFWK